MIVTRDRRKRGSILKVQFFWDYPSDPSVKLEDTTKVRTFTTEWTAKNTVRLNKEDAAIVSKEVTDTQGTHTEWYAYLDTEVLGTGALKLLIIADVVDSDSPFEQTKTEIAECDTYITIYD